MEPTSKRKRNSDAGKVNNVMGTQPAKKKAKKQPSKKQRLQAIISPREDVFNKIPAEIRNHIYDLVLAPEPDDGISKYASYSVAVGHAYRAASNYKRKSPRWTEPALLRTAKWIRHEAAPVYYGTRVFDVTVTSAKVVAACDWLRGVEEKAQGRLWTTVLGTFTITGGKWEDVRSWLPLAKLFKDVDFGQTARSWENGFIEDSGKVYWVLPYIQGHLFEASKEIVKLGLKARDKGWSDRKLERKFKELIEPIMRSKEAKPRSEKAKVKVQKSYDGVRRVTRLAAKQP